MKIVADLEVHSKFARAVSPQMDVPTIAKYAAWKGIGVVGTGDFTHPFWFSELKRSLEPAEPGLFRLQPDLHPKGEDPTHPSGVSAVRFLLTAELSSIYSHNGKTRRIHNLIFAPTLEVVEKINQRLVARGCNLRADGRPVIGLSSKEVLKIVLDVSTDAMVVPAHVWTPWFSLFGSMSGYDSIEECFEELTPYIQAIETGLSSDPAMNWRLSKLDSVAIVSFGDAHSPQNLMREATVFEVEELSYASIVEAINNGSALKRAELAGREHPEGVDPGLHPPGGGGRVEEPANQILKTLEFYPEEGMYHFDGHRNCAVRWSPKETLDHQGICVKCGKNVTVGVMHRVEKLADRPEGFRPDGSIPYEHLVPLDEIIAEAFGVKSANSKKVLEEYERLVTTIAPEYQLLSEIPIDEMSKHSPRVAEGIERVRRGELSILPGFDGQYGTIDIFPETELSTPQASLF